MTDAIPLLLVACIGLLSSCESESNSLVVGDLLFSPAIQHKQVSAEVAEVDFVFDVFNQGAKPIQILGLDADCACIDESISQPLILPGQNSKITATYRTDGVTGIDEKLLQVKTDQSIVGDAALQIKLEVEPIYKFSERRLTWNVNEPSTSKVVDFVVTRVRPIHLVAADPSRTEFSVDIKELEAGRHYQIEITPTTTAKFMIGFIRLHTDCEVKNLARPLLYTTVKD